MVPRGRYHTSLWELTPEELPASAATGCLVRAHFVQVTSPAPCDLLRTRRRVAASGWAVTVSLVLLLLLRVLVLVRG